MKRMKALLVGLLSIFSLFGSLSAQEDERPKRGRVGVELGTISGIHYEYTFTDHLTLRGSAGLLFAGAGVVISNNSGLSFSYDGFVPYVALAPYWYYGGARDSGGFFALSLESYWTNMRILVDRSRFDRNHLYTFRLTPTWGYVRPVSEELAMRFFTGLSLGWHGMRTDEGVEFVRDKSSFPITFGVGIDYRL